MRVVLFAILAFLSLTAMGQTYVVASDIGDSTLVQATYHVTTRLNKHHNGTIDIFWNRSDSNNYLKASIGVPAIIDIDPNHPSKIKTKIIRRHEGCDSILLEQTISKHIFDHLGLRLKAANGRAFIILDQNNQIEVPLDFNHPAEFGAACSDHLQGEHHSLICAFKYKPPLFANLSYAKIIDRLRESSDPVEGIWQYFDRDLPQKHISLAHKYTLAAISDGDGGYTLVDITHPDRPLPLKGHISPTIFQDNYNLVWYPAKGNIQDDDCYAEISMQSNLITLNFPVIKSSFRLFKVPKEKILPSPIKK